MRTWYSMKKAGDKSAEILIYDQIGADPWTGEGLTAKDFAKAVRALGSVQTLTVRINSPGGDVFDGLAIHNTLKRHAAKVNVRVDGIAASPATLIAMAGDTITVPDNAFLLIQSPTGYQVGTADDMLAMAAELERLNTAFAETYAGRSGGRMTIERARALMKEDRLMPAAEARELGLADVVAEPVRMAAAFDMSGLAPKARKAVKDATMRTAAAVSWETTINAINERTARSLGHL